HLTPEEIEGVLSSSLGRAAALTPEGDLQEVQKHLSECDVCRRMSTVYAEEAGRLERLKGGSPVVRGPDCPPESTWLHPAAGTISPAEAAVYLEHAAGCDHCGSLMRSAVDDFADQTTPEEERILAELASRQPAWQQR